jgi:hypothetical protein
MLFEVLLFLTFFFHHHLKHSIVKPKKINILLIHFLHLFQ